MMVEGRRRSVLLYQISYFLVGRPVGKEKVIIFFFFPQLFRPNSANNYLSQEILKRWNDRIFLPAVYNQIHSSISQYYPADYKYAKIGSMTQNLKIHAARDKDRSRYQFVSYILQTKDLEEI